MFNSLRAQLLIRIILFISVILAGLGVIQFNQRKAAAEADLKLQCELTASRLASVLPDLIYACDDPQVARALTSEMENQNFRQILVIANKDTNGFCRDADWKIMATSKPEGQIPTLAAKLIYDPHGAKEEVGELQIFSDPRFVTAALKKELIHTGWVILFLDAAILIVMSIVLGLKILKPMREIASTIVNIASTRNTGVRLSTRGATEINRLVDSINNLLEANQQIATIAQKLGNGDLTVQVEPVSDKDTMGQALKRMLSNLRELLSEIQSVSLTLNEGSEGVSSASRGLSSQTTEEAASVQQISNTLIEIASKARSNAENSEIVRILSVEAKNAAGSGYEQMRLMVQSMNEINSSSTQINKVIKVIDDIAFQTNLLALNAAVEAARAGRHGKGFAVVADEVRNLAGRSAKAARETGELVENTLQKVKCGAEIAGKTNTGLQSIVASVIKTTDLIEEIALASKEQASGVEQITGGIESIEASTQHNCATAEETAAAAEELTQLAVQLQDLLHRFKFQAS